MVMASCSLLASVREHHSAGPSLSTTRPIQQYNEDLDNFRNNSKLAQENPYALPPDHPAHPEHVNNLLNCRDSDTHTLLHSMDSLILTSMAKPEYTSIDMPPVYPYPSTNAILQGGPLCVTVFVLHTQFDHLFSRETIKQSCDTLDGKVPGRGNSGIKTV